MRFPACLLGTVLLCAAQESADFRVSVDLVPVTCAVTSKDGQPVLDMQAEDFVLLDNGKPRPLQYLWRELDAPLTVGLVVDISGSQSQFLRQHRRTIAQFLEQVLRPQDQAFMVAVGPGVKLAAGLTNSYRDLRAAVERLDPRLLFNPRNLSDDDDLGDQCQAEPPHLPAGFRFPAGIILPKWYCGGTLLWNGVYSSARLKTKSVSGRKALVVLTDGLDTGHGDGTHTLSDAIEAAQGADTVVYTIHYAAHLPAILRLSSGIGLRRLSTQTGGRAFEDPKGDPSEIFTLIERDLRSLYVLAFSTPEKERDGKFHRLEVKSKRRGLTVRARKGYQAVP
jgi:VWFA-related protein